MENLKIRVNSADESKEAQDLFFKLGYEWQSGESKYLNCGLDIFYILSRENGEMSYCDVAEVDFNSKNNGYSFFKTITLPELRAMANQTNEYLEPLPNGEYKYHSNLSLVGGDWVRIPEGAIRARFYPNDPDALEFEGDFCQWWHDENNEWINYENYSNTLKHSRVVWQRDQDEPFLTPECTLNDQYAEIEQVRQVEIHGTVKAEPDLNFGEAQASGGAKMRENNHYFINVSDVDEVDFYEIAKRYNVTDPAVQHILKKCLAIGNRGHKDLETDLKDILKTAKRALQINGFGE